MLWADTKSANLGVRVLAEGSVLLAQRVWGEQAEVVTQDFTGAMTGVPLGGRSLVVNAAGRGKEVNSFLRSFDIVLDTGAGDSFSDIYGLKRLMIMTHVQSLCKRLGSTLVLAPQTIGPFNSRIGRYLARRTLKIADVVSARDTVSYQVARRLGRTDVIPSSDLVFCLPVPRVDFDNSHDILLNVSGLLWKRNPHIDYRLYQNNIAELIYRLNSSGRSVKLLPHVLANPSDDDDENVLGEVLNLSGVNCPILLPKSLSDARRTVRSANLVIASRMHASLNALSVGTPSIPWAYSRKFAPLMEQLDWQHVVDLRTASDPVEETMSIINLPPSNLRASAARTAAAGRTRIDSTIEILAGDYS